MNSTVMDAAEWHRELVAGFAADRTGLHESQVMRIRRLARAEQARLLGDEPKMGLVAVAAWRAHSEYALVNGTMLMLSGGIRCRSSFLKSKIRGTSDRSRGTIGDYRGGFRRHDREYFLFECLPD